MEKRFLTLAVLLMVVALLGTSAVALTPMGPPTAGLRTGQYSAGVAYSYSKLDHEFNHGMSPGGGANYTADNMTMHFVLSHLGYGIRDNWEAFLRIGGGAAQFSNSGRGQSLTTDRKGYVLGFGTKRTFHEDVNIKWGGLFQIFWAQAHGRATAPVGPYTANIELMEIQIAAGPTYQLRENVSIYGGPFVYIVDGRFTGGSRTGAGRISYDIDQSSTFGGYVGTEITVAENTTYSIEYQHTATDDSLGMSLIWKF